MANDKNEMFKTVSFRLNLSRDDECEIYTVIESIENNEQFKETFENKSRFIKTALKDYINCVNAKEDTEKRCIQTEHYMEELVEKMKTEFLLALADHDKELIAGIINAVMQMNTGSEYGYQKVQAEEQTSMQKVSSTVEGILPESNGEIPLGAMDFLDSL